MPFGELHIPMGKAKRFATKEFINVTELNRRDEES